MSQSSEPSGEKVNIKKTKNGLFIESGSSSKLYFFLSLIFLEKYVFFLSKKKKKKKIFLCPVSSLLEKAFHLLVVAFDFASSQTNRAALKIRPPYVIGIQVASSLNKEK